MKMFSEEMLKYKQETNYNYNEVYRQSALNLMGLSEDPTILSGEAYDEVKMAPIHEARKDRAGTFLIHINNLMLNYLFHQYDKALKHAILARPLLDAVLAKYDVAIFWYYEGLVSMAAARENSGHNKRRLLRRAKKNISQFRKWANYSPENHQHKLDLLIAEMAWCMGKDDIARRHYDLAIKGAGNGEFLNEEALSLERAGLYYLSAGQDFIAENYLRKAYQTYKEWGAVAKVEDLIKRFPKILIGFDGDIHTLSASTKLGTTSLAENSTLDLDTLMKAAEAISGEIILERLLKTLLDISIKNAGAESGCIIMKKGQNWYIKSAYFAEMSDPSKYVETPLHESDRVPESLIDYIQNTKQSLVLDDISKDHLFLNDPVVKSIGLKSVMCLPLFSKGKTEGILYLENNLQTSVFTEGRVRFLELLSGQIAVSLENAQLYENLEMKIDERTSELNSSLNNLKSMQEQLIQQEKLASLGQLTAGIAHEIKNPLNFVNNFSEVSIEMINEALEELEKPISSADRDEMLIRENLVDIKSNLEKIHGHGSRANGILTSMLQHSRGGSGVKEPTNLNALVREFSKLAFHGMRAGKNPINAEIDLQLDDKIMNVPLIGEDFSRVILNLCNNAFDAMRTTADERLPKLTIRTKMQSEMILIEVEDNGPGIPDEIRDRILQPFFTTKKGTDGTGLGLSISNDIIKAHGGKIKIDSKVAVGTKFTISMSFTKEAGYVIEKTK